MANVPDTAPPDMKQFRRQMESAIAAADTHRVAALQGMVDVRAAREVVLLRQRAALAQGDATALDARISANRSALGMITADLRRAKTVVSKATSSEWVLTGYLLDAQGLGVADQTVALYVGRRALEGVAATPSDAAGRFEVRVPLAGAKARGVSPDAAGKKATVDAVDVRVLSPKGRSVYQHPEAVPVVAGEVTYLEMAIRDEGAKPIS